MNKQEIQERHQLIKKLHFIGLTPKEISQNIPADYISVLRVLNNNNLKLEGSGGKNRKITHNFLKENTDKNYYFIGYLAADGNISGNRISISSIDKKFLKSFVNIYKVNFNYYYRKESDILMLHFCNEEIVKFLKETYNIVPNKSLKLKLSIVNWSIIRGIFDGDGSAKKEIKFTTGSEQLKDQLVLFFEKYNIITKVRAKEAKHICYDVIILAQSHAEFAYNLYKDADIYLNRKYDNVCALLSRDNKEKWDKLLET
jgi:hypothetical protein